MSEKIEVKETNGELESELRYVEESRFSVFKEKWAENGGFLLVALMWTMIFFSDSIFGATYGSIMEGFVVGVCSLLFITLNGERDWFGIKNARNITFTILGIANIGIAFLLLIY